MAMPKVGSGGGLHIRSGGSGRHGYLASASLQAPPLLHVRCQGKERRGRVGRGGREIRGGREGRGGREERGGCEERKKGKEGTKVGT